jgi:hypothetical protein
MRPAYPTRGSVVPKVLVGVALLSFGVVGTVGTLWATGKIELPFLNRKKPPSGGPPGTSAVPVTARAIPAYTRLTRDHFWDTNKGAFAVMYLYPQEIRPGTQTNLNEMLGRVLAFDKAAGYVVNEKELLPKGTRAGLAGGVPPGKRALVLEAAKIAGIYGLRTGDHLDLVASAALDTKGGAGAGRLPGGALVASAGALEPRTAKRATVQVLAQDAVLVSAVTTRDVPVTTSSLTQGMRVTTKPVQEVVIAVDPEEVPGITEALAIDAAITAVARSGRPEAPRQEKGILLPAKPGVTVVETIRGTKRTTLVFPADGGRAAADDKVTR